MKQERDIVIEARDVCKYFPVRGAIGNTVGHVKAVDGVSLDLYRGETYGVVGETGCGKSTLGRSLMRLFPITSGTVKINGQDMKDMPNTVLRKQIQMIFQDPYNSLNPRQRIGDILTETLTIHNLGAKNERMDVALEMLGKVGLHSEHYYRYPHELSGGQRQRVGIARAIILNPDIVVCDEPVSALDVSVRSQIINLLLDMQDARDLTYMFISHDMSVIRYAAKRVGIMYLGHLVEESETDELFANPCHPYTQVLLSAVPSPNPHTKRNRIVLEGDLPSPMHPPTGCVFHTRCPYATARCTTECPSMKHVNDGHRVACHLMD